MRKFKNTYAAKGSALFEALKVSQKVAEKVYKVTEAEYEKRYSASDREWFANWKPIHVA